MTAKKRTVLMTAAFAAGKAAVAVGDDVEGRNADLGEVEKDHHRVEKEMQ